MKRFWILGFMILIAQPLFVEGFSPDQIEIARRGGGGGGRGGGGGGGRGGGGRSVSRSNSPSMSRATQRPAQRPSQSIQRPQNIQRPTQPIQRPQNIQRPTQPIQRPQNIPNRQLERTREINPNRTISRSNLVNIENSNRLSAARVRGDVLRNNPRIRDWFGDRFFADRNFYPPYYNQGNWWRAATWASAAAWLGWEDTYPIYYDNQGEANQIPADVYNYSYSQTTYQEPQQEPEGDWLSLGVFAAGRTAEQAAFSNMYVQLAVNREGDISGTYYNAGTDKTQLLQGSVNPTTQEASWTISERENSPVISTGVYNLTQDIANVSVEFSNGTEQNWVLVRIKQ